MRRLAVTSVILCALVMAGEGSLLAWPWGAKTLVTINGQGFTTEDFRNWWANWREKETPFPDGPGPFVDWHLLVEEATKMELFREPTYQGKVDTFLKARALMIFKGEAVDSKIEIKDEDLRKRYDEEYCPRWGLRVLYFDKEEKARRAFEGLSSGGLTVEDVAARPHAEGGPLGNKKGWVRPVTVPEEWRDTLAVLEKGAVSAPLSWGNVFVVLCVEEKEGSGEADFAAVKEGIRKKIWDARQGELTGKLIRHLREKYHVTVDTALFDAIDVDASQEDLLDKPLIVADRGKVLARSLVEQVRADQSLRKGHPLKEGEIEGVKQGVLEGMISQMVTSWEALDQHYEERPPFKWVYRFYCQHRLIRELEERLFEPKAAVSDDEVTAFYRDHLGDFTPPDTVSIAVLEDDARLAEKMWQEVSRGEDFFSVAQKYYSHAVPVQQVPVEHLVPEMKTAIEKLAKGEVSPPFEINGRSTLVKFLDRKAGTPIPLEEVREKIADRLRDERRASLKKAFIEQLRVRSNIAVNERAWEAIRRELGDQDGGKEG